MFGFGSGKAGGVANAILQSSMISPASFYSNVFAATAHTSWLHTSNTAISRQDKLLQIQAKGLALTSIRKEVTATKGFMSDALLCSMLLMSAYGNGDSWDYSDCDHRSLGPPTFAYDAGFYGTVDWEPAHIISAVTLLQARGGLHTITLSGLKEAAIL